MNANEARQIVEKQNQIKAEQEQRIKVYYNELKQYYIDLGKREASNTIDIILKEVKKAATKGEFKINFYDSYKNEHYGLYYLDSMLIELASLLERKGFKVKGSVKNNYDDLEYLITYLILEIDWQA